MYKKIIFIAIVLFNFFIPILVSAEVAGANSQIPALNPFCWKKKDCIDVRRNFVEGSPTDKELADNGFVSDVSTAPCNSGTGDQQWGRCLPAGVTKTEIDFGGKPEFANVGEFIVFMYKWLVTIASIVAVIMIIVAGIQWITSGGNSESISSAKHRIGGAVVGLFIAYLSYFILNTINPNLVNFRIPQIWLVRPQNLIPEYCSEIPDYDKLKFAYVYDADKEGSPFPPLNKLEYKLIKEHSNNLCCGCIFLTDKGGTASCMGDYCKRESDNKNMVCVRDNKRTNPFGCYEADLVIHFSFHADLIDELKRSADSIPIVRLLTSKAMDDDWLNTEAVVRAVCKRYSDGAFFMANGGGAVKWGAAGKILTIPYQKNNDYYEYSVVYKDLVDPAVIQKNFDCSGFTRLQKTKLEGENHNIPQLGEVVGYFIRNEVKVKQEWVKEYSSMITGAKVGAIAGWLIPIPRINSTVGALIGGGIGWIIDESNGPPRSNLNIGYKDGNAIFGAYATRDIIEVKPIWDQLAPIKGLDNYIPIDQLRSHNGLRLEVPLNLRGLGVMMLNKSSVPKNDSILGLPSDLVDPHYGSAAEFDFVQP